MTTEDAPLFGVRLDLRGASHTRALKAQVEAANACKKADETHHAAPPTDLARAAFARWRYRAACTRAKRR
jgi:hypothetical protein